MKVVFLQNNGTNKKGEVKEVADGFAKNFLFPKKIAKPLDTSAKNELSQAKQANDFHHAENLKKAEATKAEIEKLLINIKAKIGDNGKLFGAISSKEVGDELAKSGIEVDRKKIELDLIKSEGEYTAKIKLYGGVVATLKVSVTRV